MRTPSSLTKAPRTSRRRAPNLVVERRTNAWAGMIGYLTGRGFASVKIAAVLGDGTTPETVRGVWRRWGLTNGRERANAVVPIEISQAETGLLQKRADALGISPDEWLRRVASCAIRDDLYDAVTDGKFEVVAKLKAAA
jgi:hypothetical protein